MLAFAFMLGVSAYVVEMLIGYHLPILRRYAQQHILFNLFASLAITWSLSVLFHAEGLTVMAGSLISALLSIVTYRIWRE
mgnify:CR=1 FL=1|jgi:hypothetical protein